MSKAEIFRGIVNEVPVFDLDKRLPLEHSTLYWGVMAAGQHPYLSFSLEFSFTAYRR